MGIEGNDLYTADITRVFPISGRFSRPQRRVYDTVLRAQLAGIDAARAGADFLAPHRAAMRVIVESLVDWHLLDEPIDTILSEQLHRRWTLHGTSHHLGLDVHDCSAARSDIYRTGTLRPGMVITVEPGLYFQAYDRTVPRELRGIGVRIEDDVLITDDGPRVLSVGLPKQADDVEAWMAGLR
jgi:Xaa-Pro aminopeptidase